jgi:outer membrane protein OmpA-like peptidoglycan-associated protein
MLRPVPSPRAAFAAALVLLLASASATTAAASAYTDAQADALEAAAAHEVADHDPDGEAIFLDLARKARGGSAITNADLPDSMRDDVRNGRRDTQESEHRVGLRHLEERLAAITPAVRDGNAARVAHAQVDAFIARRELSENRAWHTCAREALAHAEQDLAGLVEDGDRDRDGIPDSRDQCPDEPEDRDGFQDEDGCPDPDNDRDGILDGADRCPNEPETRNGFQDEDGCPDEKPAATLRPVHFASDSSRLDGDAIETLASNAAILKDSPSLRVTLVGHCDAQNSDSYNYRLGHRRAEAVKGYLVDYLGIAPDRLSTESSGEDDPVADNATEEGRRANRRVEFVSTGL